MLAALKQETPAAVQEPFPKYGFLDRVHIWLSYRLAPAMEISLMMVEF
jgi:hypothetical protein